MKKITKIMIAFSLTLLTVSGCAPATIKKNGTSANKIKKTSTAKIETKTNTKYYIYQNSQEIMMFQITTKNNKVSGALYENYIQNNQVQQMTNDFSGLLAQKNLKLNFKSNVFGEITSTQSVINGEENSKNTITINISENKITTNLIFNVGTWSEYNSAIDNFKNQSTTSKPVGNQINNSISNSISNNATQNSTTGQNGSNTISNSTQNQKQTFTQSEALNIAKQIPSIANEYKIDSSFTANFQNINPIITSNGLQEYTIAFGDKMGTSFSVIFWVEVRSDGTVQDGLTNSGWVLPKNYS